MPSTTKMCASPLNCPRIGTSTNAAANAVNEIALGDFVVVALSGNRLGRIGEVTGKAVENKGWNPLVPPGPRLPKGEMGRRIFVRWDLTCGPDDRDLVIKLSEKKLSPGELRNTVAKIRSMSIAELKAEMNDPTNWVSLLGFVYERA